METVLIIGGVLIFGIIVSIHCLVTTLKHLQWQIDFRKKEVDELRKKNHELTMRMIKVEGTTNRHEIQINGVNFKSDINGIDIKHLIRLSGR